MNVEAVEIEGTFETEAAETRPALTETEARPGRLRAALAELRRKGRRGMTLIEIMVVMLLISLIGTALAFGFIELLGEGEEDAARAQLATIAKGLDLHALKKRSLPDTLQVLVEDGKLTADQLNDPWGGEITYTVTGRRTYEICTSPPESGKQPFCVRRENKRSQ